MKWIDIPPVWLAWFCALAYLQGQLWPVGLGALGRWGGAALVGAGIVLIVLAAAAMAQSRTTIIPHLDPDALVSHGIFARTRNPIYLADLLILAGLCLRWDALPALVLVPVLFVVLERRFIRAEEARLRAHFGADFDAYAGLVRRWL